MGSPRFDLFAAGAPLRAEDAGADFCLVLEGEITLVLDTAEVHLTPAIRWCNAAQSRLEQSIGQALSRCIFLARRSTLMGVRAATATPLRAGRRAPSAQHQHPPTGWCFPAVRQRQPQQAPPRRSARAAANSPISKSASQI
jgi:hypothetical protein